MPTPDPQAVRVDLSAQQARALVQLLQRLSWRQCQALADDEPHAERMFDAAHLVCSAMAQAGQRG